MPLTPETLASLKRAFPYADHEFIKGFVYLSEEAICDRIEEVDPSWSFDILRAYREGDQSICAARLSVCGVSRDCVGMQKVMENAGEPEKGAATDALKRGARLFGIGRYLLAAPKEKDGFDKWLAGEQKKSNPTPAPQPSLTVVPGGKATPSVPSSTRAVSSVANGSPSGSDKSADLLDQMSGERGDALQTAINGDGSFLCNQIERKQAKGTKTRWLDFIATEPTGGSAIAFSRSETPGLKDSINAEHYNLLDQNGTVFVETIRVFYRNEKNGEKEFRKVVRVVAAEVAEAVTP